MKKILLISVLVLTAALAFAIAPVVSNVLATPSSGKVTITYDLTADDVCQITVVVSADGGTSYNIIPTALSGAGYGDQITAGNGKQIIWQPGDETPPMVVGSNYKVKVIARDNPTQNESQLLSFIRVEGGTFNNGTSNVSISPFFIDKYEVTQSDFLAVMSGTHPSYFNNKPNRPKELVSWYHAIEYCNRRSMQEGFTPCYSYSTYGTNPANWPAGWNTSDANHTNLSCDWSANGYRLPTEMEWMFAGKGGIKSEGYSFSGSNTANDVAWTRANSDTGDGQGRRTHDVGELAPNEIGTYDMSGNVWEFVWDIRGNYPTGNQTNPTGATTGTHRVVRGGGVWHDPTRYLWTRENFTPTGTGGQHGFRVVRRTQQQYATPTFNAPPGVYNSTQTVSISSTDAAASIRYTTDGSEPTMSSALYSSPLSISSTTTLKARAFKDGAIASDIATAVYVFNLIYVAGGTFSRQNSNGSYPNPAVNVTLSAFYIGKYEVTQAEYQAVMGSNPSSFSGNPNRPVEQVSWFKAIEYCNRRSIKEGIPPCYSYSTYGTNPDNWPSGWNTDYANHTNVSCNWNVIGYRLPTEMEWMYAAKGRTESFTYSGSSTIGNVARYSVNSSSRPWDTGSLAANGLGTYDMSGNVWEWCWDIYGNYPTGDQTNPKGATTGTQRVFRGGSWYIGAASCTVSFRNCNGATLADSTVGFRVVRRFVN